MYLCIQYYGDKRNDIVKTESPAPLCRQFPLSSVLAKHAINLFCLRQMHMFAHRYHIRKNSYLRKTKHKRTEEIQIKQCCQHHQQLKVAFGGVKARGKQKLVLFWPMPMGKELWVCTGDDGAVQQQRTKDVQEEQTQPCHC